ncbi:unnamed protein product [Rotaria sp. Silwood1]|nr:unnamed protein product [Rotaria sp. Silwood1]CAF1588653.1 unnamed protein product [Rotaria sp. Silwood1]CAF3631625.1 unnamed protein product [Rotaria sp. Silwood1]CAF3633408.1 unnamed protein product [Rotaria sp. Silwood1]CAF3680508.1 unnamed protein product [Rotaria sp. Silwood1]
MISAIWGRIPAIRLQMAQKTVVEHPEVYCAVAPCAIPATYVAVSALGFTVGGITSGNVATGMMSTAAIANGGGVAVGSVVSLLQSIGVLGVTNLGLLPAV